MPLPRTIVLQSNATRCMRSCYFLKHYKVLNIISVHSMQVASFRWAQNESRLSSGPWALKHAWWNTYTQLSSCFRDPRWMFVHLTNARETSCLFQSNVYCKSEAQISYIKYVELCKIKILDYIMRRQKQDDRCPILFVRAWHEWRLSCFDTQHWISSAIIYISSIFSLIKT